jgi:hypothetical protein
MLARAGTQAAHWVALIFSWRCIFITYATTQVSIWMDKGKIYFSFRTVTSLRFGIPRLLMQVILTRKS